MEKGANAPEAQASKRKGVGGGRAEVWMDMETKGERLSVQNKKKGCRQMEKRGGKG